MSARSPLSVSRPRRCCCRFLIAVRVYEIIARKVLNNPSPFYQYLEWEVFLLLIVLTLGYAYLRDAHVRVDVLRERLKPRTQSAIEIVGAVIFVLPVVAIVTYYGLERALSAYHDGERAAFALGGPWGWVIRAALPLSMVLFLVAVLASMMRNIGFLISGKGAPAPSGNGKGLADRSKEME